MSTVKITELPELTDLDSNTANTILVGVDIPTTTTGKITLTTLARELYSNNNLTVGNNFTILPNVVGQFTGNSVSYVQINLQNLAGNGSGDIVVTSDNGDDTNYYINMGLNGSSYNYPGYTFSGRLDGYLVVQGSNTNPTLPGGNLVVGTTTVGKDITFTQGAFDTSGQVAKFIYDTGFKLLKKPLIFADGTEQNTAVLYSGVDARVTANATSANSVINSRISSNIATVNTFAQAAFNKANNALANSSGIFGGNLSVTGDLSLLNGSLSSAGNMTVNGTMVLANSNFSDTEAALTIKATATTQTPSQNGYMLHISGKVNTPSRIVFDSFGTGAYGLVAGRSARGTVTSPTATQNNDVLMRLSGNGWGTTGFAPLGVARIDIVATENYSDTNRGSKIVFYNIADGSNTVQEIATMNANRVDFTGLVKPAKGFVYVPRILTGAQTAITINFATDSMIRATFSSTLTMSFTNYTDGKVVEAWLTNTAGNGQTINLGALANNTTTGSTTLTVAAGRSAKLQYFSIDGDLANTFVAVTYS